MPGLLRLLGPAALVVGVFACGKVESSVPPDSHVDALINLPDGPLPKDKCKDAVSVDDFSTCIDLAFCSEISACGGGNVGDTNCTDLPLEIINGLSARS